MNPECRYVAQNSGQTTYSFTLRLDSCGTQFINDFEGEAGQAYLENVLVLQVNTEFFKFPFFNYLLSQFVLVSE